MASSSAERKRTKARLPKVIARELCATGDPRRSPLGNILSSREQTELARIATVLEYRLGGVAIFSEGEDAHFLYLIDEGVVRISWHLPDGSVKFLVSCGPAIYSD